MWRRKHLDETLAAIAIPESNRFFVKLKEPAGETRQPIEFYRWTLEDAKEAGDELVQAYYPHKCDENRCGEWRRADG
jgi:hypothetical protein